jgi:hypothetical protein
MPWLEILIDVEGVGPPCAIRVVVRLRGGVACVTTAPVGSAVSAWPTMIELGAESNESGSASAGHVSDS